MTTTTINATNIRLPSLGEGIIEAQVGRWLKRKGDMVAAGDPIVEIETDKVTTELAAKHSGVLLDIAIAEGEVAAVGQRLPITASLAASLRRPSSTSPSAAFWALAQSRNASA